MALDLFTDTNGLDPAGASPRSVPGRNIVRRSVEMDRLDVQWRNWTPTFSGGESMTWDVPRATVARYLDFDLVVYFYLQAAGTTGGTADPSLTFSLPVRAAVVVGGTTSSFTAHVGDGGVVGGFGLISEGNPFQGEVRRYDLANYGLGADRRINVSGFYERG